MCWLQMCRSLPVSAIALLLRSLPHDEHQATSLVSCKVCALYQKPFRTQLSYQKFSEDVLHLYMSMAILYSPPFRYSSSAPFRSPASSRSMPRRLWVSQNSSVSCRLASLCFDVSLSLSLSPSLSLSFSLQSQNRQSSSHASVRSDIFPPIARHPRSGSPFCTFESLCSRRRSRCTPVYLLCENQRCSLVFV